jgi:ferredoxin
MQTPESDRAYTKLIARLNRFPQGAYPSETLYEILKILFSEREAALVARLPIKPFTVEKASRIWNIDRVEAQRILEELAGRAILVDVARNGESVYTLPPPMAGFFEFSMMRLRDDVDQAVLGELFYQYCNVEEDFIRTLFTDGETQLGRVYVHEPVLPPEVHVLDYERASEVIKTATHRGISTCYCRFKMQQVDRACDAPLEICMTFNASAASLIKHGFARSVDVAEGLDLLQMAYDHNLVQFGENAREGVNFICNCCGCCCEAMIAARKFGMLRPVHTTHYMPEVNTGAVGEGGTDGQRCTGCGQCVHVCPVEAMGLVSANDPHNPKRRVAKVNPALCLGCGLCARVCPTGSVTLRPREERVIPPLNGVHRVVVMAIERGQLQDLIFDNRVLWHHRLLASVLKVILNLPPVQQAMASQQVKSRYMEALVRRLYP